jgi:hypothetical protein
MYNNTIDVVKVLNSRVYFLLMLLWVSPQEATFQLPQKPIRLMLNFLFQTQGSK